MNETASMVSSDESYMQTLFKQSEPLTFWPRSLVSASSLKLGGGSHWSEQSFREAKRKKKGSKTAHTISVELTCSPNRQDCLASVHLIWTELALFTFRGNGRITLGVSERKVIVSTAAHETTTVVGTVRLRVASAVKLVRSYLQ